MSYTLGNVILKRPANMVRQTVETSAVQTTVPGRSVKDIRNRKERYVLSFQNLTQAQVSAIFGEYDLETTRTFTVSETNLTIGPTTVHIDIPDRNYTGGADYRENFVIILTEEV